MHPWANRLEGDHITIDAQQHEFPSELNGLIFRDGNGLPLHGLLLKTDRWRTEAVEAADGFIYHHAVLDFDDPDWLRIYPFPHSLDMKTYLHEEEVCIEVDVYNSGDRPMPLSFGFHPYFLIDPKKTGDLQLTIPLKNVLTVNEKMIPTGEFQPKENLWTFENDEIILGNHQFDHGFTGQERRRFYHFKQDAREFDLYLDNDYGYMQLYAPNQPDRPYVCIEPMLAPTNALNTNACKMLAPGGFITEEFTISFYDEQFKG
jgi:galactose mutarotase-like enzyme